MAVVRRGRKDKQGRGARECEPWIPEDRYAKVPVTVSSDPTKKLLGYVLVRVRIF